MASSMPRQQGIKQLKRSDLVAEEIKRLITERNLNPGDKLPREIELQQQFEVSKGTIREALKSLEVQGLVKISTGPGGGGTGQGAETAIGGSLVRARRTLIVGVLRGTTGQQQGSGAGGDQGQAGHGELSLDDSRMPV